MREIVLARVRQLANQELDGARNWPGYKPVEIPSDTGALSDIALVELFEKLVSRRAAIDSAPQC